MSMRKLLALALMFLFASPACAGDRPETDEQKTLYALGMMVSRTLSVFDLTPAELEVVKRGLTDAANGRSPEVDLGVYSGKVQELARARRRVQGEKMAAANKDFLDKAAREKDAVRSNSGLVYVSLKEGTGAAPGPTDTVTVNYRGTLPDGREFDSSYKRGTPTELRMDGVIRCWTEGLRKMKAGGKAKLVCPSSIAYGDTGAGDLILPGATLVFEVELLDVKRH